MRPEIKKYLTDMADAGAEISHFCVGRTELDFTTDKQFRSAVYYQFVIIGEALAQLRRLDESTFDQISEGSRIVAFRNQVVHGYQVIRDVVTWQIIQEKLPILIRELAAFLPENRK